MADLIFIALTSFITVLLMVPLIKPVACYVGLVDRPGGRKRHVGAIPLTGGIAIFSALLVCVATGFIESNLLIRMLVIGAGFMVLVGVLDDRLDISARIRLCAQILIASLFVYGLEIKLVHLGDFFGHVVPLPGIFSSLLSILGLVALINAFNMLDGIDGLVGTLALISFSGVAIVASGMGLMDVLSVAVCLVASVLAFLIFNLYGRVERASICKAFMGDAGSMFLGLLLGVVLFYLSMHTLPAEKGEHLLSPLVVLWFVLFPITDMVTTVYRRLRSGRSPFAPDRTHIHHILTRAGFSKYQVLMILSSVQLMTVVVGLLIAFGVLNDLSGYAAAFSFVVLYQYFIKRCWRMARFIRRSINSQSVNKVAV